MIVLPPASPSHNSTRVAILTEKFKSFQGEGPLAGQHCAFIRLSRCNLRCSWCDTKNTWDWSQFDPAEVSTKVDVQTLVDWVDDCAVDLVVITGGEPMIQKPALTALTSGVAALARDVRIQIETNGTVAPWPELTELVDCWVSSPKLANSGLAYGSRIVPSALHALQDTGRAAFKFVITDPDTDLPEIDQLVTDFGLRNIWVMPEGDTAETVLAGMAALRDPAGTRGWNLSSRLHILAGAQ